MPPPPVPKKKHEHAIVAVTVVSGAGLRDCERFGKMDPYVTVRLDDSSRSTTVVKGGGTDCKFGDELLYHVDERPMSLMVDAFDKESIGKDDHIGSGEVTLDGPNKVKIGAPLGVTVELTAPGDDAGKGGAGQVELQVLFQIDATPLLKCGFLEKKSSTWPSWDRRWFELRGEILVYFHDVSGSRRLAGELSLADCKEVRSSTAPDKRDAEWELVHNSRTYRFASENEEETLEWITACTAAMSGIACEGPPPIDAPSPAHSDAMAEDSDGSPRGKSAPREAAFVRKYLSTMTGKPAKGEVGMRLSAIHLQYLTVCSLCVPGYV